MENNKQQGGVEWLVCQLQQTRDWQRVINEANQSTTAVRNVLQQAKEIEKERMIKLIQFIVSEKELVDYGSVSKETANYYLDKFNQGGEQ